MSERRLGIVKRISLAGLSEGWDDCFVLASPVTYGELKSLKDLNTEGLDEDEAFVQIISFVKGHVAGGKVKVLEGTDLVDSDIEKNDIDSMSVEMVNHIFEEMTGTGAQYVDPKASTPTTQTPASTDEKSPAPDAPTTTS